MTSNRAQVLAGWDRADEPLAPLTADQREDIAQWGEFLGQGRPLPKEVKKIIFNFFFVKFGNRPRPRFQFLGENNVMVTSQSARSLTTGTGAKSTRTGSDTNSQSERVSEAAAAAAESLFPAFRKLERSTRIDTGHQFLEWLHQIENNLQNQEDAPYRNYIKQLELYREEADDLLSQVSKRNIHRAPFHNLISRLFLEMISE